MMANKPLQSIKFPGLSDTYTTPQVDATLTTTGAAADAKKTGDEITSIKQDLSEKGLSDTAKTALLACFAHVAWVDEDGMDYYTDLQVALGMSPEPPIVYPKGIYTFESYLTNHYIDANGEIQEASGSIACEDYIPVNTPVLFIGNMMENIVLTNASFTANAINYRVSQYDSSKNHLLQTHFHGNVSGGWDYAGNVITLEPTTKYIRVSIYNASTTDGYFVYVGYRPLGQTITMEIGDIDGTTGQNISSSGNARIRSDFIPINSSKIKVRQNPFGKAAQWNKASAGIRCYDENKTYIGLASSFPTPFPDDDAEITLQSGTKFIRFVFYLGSQQRGTYVGANSVNMSHFESFVQMPMIIDDTEYYITTAL